MNNVAIVAITKNGLNLGKKIHDKFTHWVLYAPDKFSDDDTHVTWFNNKTPEKIGELFLKYDALICIFSLGAVIRLISPYLVNKKTDPAVIVIDDAATHVISALSGHLGGANELSNELADVLGATPVITTAADVNRTIVVDLVHSHVTSVSACITTYRNLVIILRIPNLLQMYDLHQQL